MMSTQHYLPDVVKQFITFFYENVKAKKAEQLRDIYHTQFGKVTDRFYRASSWPPPAAIAPLVKADFVFLNLYRDLTFRHALAIATASGSSTLPSADVADAAAVSEALTAALPAPSSLSTLLPLHWQFEILVGCVEHACLWQGNVLQAVASVLMQEADDEADEKAKKAKKAKKKGASSGLSAEALTQSMEQLSLDPAEDRLLRDSPNVWSVESVRSWLAKVTDSFSVESETGRMATIVMAYLLVLEGKYSEALAALEPFNFEAVPQTVIVPRARILFYYTVTLALFMSQRYCDAAAVITRALDNMAGIERFPELVSTEASLHAILALTMALTQSLSVDEQLANAVREQHGEVMGRVQAGEATAVEALFAKAAPQFLAPSFGDNPAAAMRNARLAQLKIVVREAEQASMLPKLHSYLRLYKTLPLAKLATLLEVTEEECTAALDVFRTRSTSVEVIDLAQVTKASAPTRNVTTADLEVTLQDGIVTVREAVLSSTSDTLFRHVQRCAEISAQFGETPAGDELLLKVGTIRALLNK
uniref:Eukaryotic translation initiation factor 3 subunit L n=1 Tax=Sexangularia sp. CB-2014 TaxID=1486929 RepID=A0A6U0IDY6_9EUKA|mmetsp:Transcript_14791/g.46390  ORF Transcript_14791/g.46390 Transcript_14791/m.46390 type:complete len:534 (+) Transcript_14791:1-1602(+)